MDVSFYAVGNCLHGQLGVPGDENNKTDWEKISFFSSLEFRLKSLKSGGRHNIVISEGGTVFSWGDNQYGQLGRPSQRNRIPQRIDALETMYIVDGACGNSFTVLLSKDGIITFGANTKGELGQGDKTEEGRTKPKQIKAKFSRFVQVSCGSNYCLALTENGEVIGWGESWMGQLGYGNFVTCPTPQPEIPTLFGCPITMLACGESHSLALSISGEVFSFGSNKFGELGINDANVKNTFRPSLIRPLLQKQIIKVCCGSYHSMALSATGRLYTWGSNSVGQLGHGDVNHQTIPKVVQHFVDYHVIDIAAGSRHSVAIASFISDSKKYLYSWGAGGSGQLGLGDTQNRHSPCRVRYFDYLNVVSLSCGGEFTVVVCSEKDETMEELNSNNHHHDGGGVSAKLTSSSPSIYSPTSPKFTMGLLSSQSPLFETTSLSTFFGVSPLSFVNSNSNFLTQKNDHNTSSSSSSGSCSGGGGSSCNNNNAVIPSPQFPTLGKRKDHYVAKPTICYLTYTTIKSLIQNNKITKLQSKIKRVFSSPGSTNCSFLDNSPTSTNHFFVSELNHGVNLKEVRMSFTLLLEIYDQAPKIMTTLANATNKLAKSLPHVHFDQPSTLRLFLIILEIPWMSQPDQYHIVLEQICTVIFGLPQRSKEILMNWLSRYRSEFFTRVVSVFSRYLSFLVTNGGLEKQVVTAVLVLELVYKANEMGNQVVPYQMFYNNDVCERVNLAQEFLTWKNSKRVFSFCAYPFLLTTEAKRKILGIDASHQMKRYAILAVCKLSDPFFTLNLRRDHLIEDTLNHLEHASEEDVRKPIRVNFEGEQAVDNGGVAKEFFYLAIDGLLHAKYGIFLPLSSNYYWFNSNYQFEDRDRLFRLTGLLLGMAIYNGVLIPTNFPLPIYRKLLSEKVSFADFEIMEPEIAHSFKQLRTLNNVDDLNLTFELITTNYLGERVSAEIIPGGKDIVVTDSNKLQFIEQYINYYVHSSVRDQFEPFRAGFFHSCSKDILSIFRAEELELLICGSSELDFIELKNHTEYFNGYNANSQAIIWFWEIVLDFDADLQKKFLLFTSGSDRAPISGLSQLQFKIQRSGPHSDALPVAHTCFNLLDLPDYNDKEFMKQKLLKSLENYRGFGLV